MAFILRSSRELSRTSRRQLPVLRYRSYTAQRWQSTHTGSTSPPDGQKSQLLRIASIVATIGVGAATVNYFTSSNKDTSTTPPGAVAQKSLRVLSLKEADAKLSRYCGRIQMAPGSGKAPVVHFCSLPSNSPTEDRITSMIGEGVGSRPTLYAAVFDGHAGYWTSQLLSESFLLHVSSALSQSPSSATDEDIIQTIKSSFIKYDDEITRKALHGLHQAQGGDPDALIAALPATSGSCALVAMYDLQDSKLRIACVGDSRAVLGSWSPDTSSYVAEALSKDQTGFNDDEVKRIAAAHPGEGDKILDRESGRLLGLAVTRAFGDHRWKWSLQDVQAAQAKLWATKPRPDYVTPPYMSAEPEVTTRTVGDGFAILASDGLWDVMSNEDAVECMSRWVEARKKKRSAQQPQEMKNNEVTASDDGHAEYKASRETFAIEDLDNAAKCLVKNALGGRRRDLFRSLMSIDGPASRYARDDISVQVIFFGEEGA